MDETYMDKAIENYNVASELYSAFSNSDESYLSFIAYHLQQSVELAMKYLLDKYGVDYPKTHDLNQLMICANINNVDLYTTDYIYNNAALLSNWKANTRYVLNYMVELNRVDNAFKGVKEYIENIAEHENNIEKNNHYDYPSDPPSFDDGSNSKLNQMLDDDLEL